MSFFPKEVPVHPGMTAGVVLLSRIIILGSFLIYREVGHIEYLGKE